MTIEWRKRNIKDLRLNTSQNLLLVLVNCSNVLGFLSYLSEVLSDQEDPSERSLTQNPEQVEVRRLSFFATFSGDVGDVDFLRRVVGRRCRVVVLH